MPRRKTELPKAGVFRLHEMAVDVIAMLPRSEFASVRCVCRHVRDMVSSELLRVRRFELGSAESGVVIVIKNAQRPVWEVVDVTGGQFRVLAKTPDQGRAGFASLDHELFVVGGMLHFQVTAQVKCYDTREDEWFDMPPLRKARCWCGCAVVEGRLVAAGGTNTAGDHLSSIEVFDPKAQTWGDLPPIRARMLHAIGSKLFALNTHRGVLWCLDTLESQWRRCVSLEPMNDVGSSSLEWGFTDLHGCLCCVRLPRNEPANFMPRLDMYDPVHDTWCRAPEPPLVRGQFWVYFVKSSRDAVTLVYCTPIFSVETKLLATTFDGFAWTPLRSFAQHMPSDISRHPAAILSLRLF